MTVYLLTYHSAVVLTPAVCVQVEPSVEALETEAEIPLPQPFQQLFVSCPDGLTVTFFLESTVG